MHRDGIHAGEAAGLLVVALSLLAGELGAGLVASVGLPWPHLSAPHCFFSIVPQQIACCF